MANFPFPSLAFGLDCKVLFPFLYRKLRLKLVSLQRWKQTERDSKLKSWICWVRWSSCTARWKTRNLNSGILFAIMNSEWEKVTLLSNRYEQKFANSFVIECQKCLHRKTAASYWMFAACSGERRVREREVGDITARAGDFRTLLGVQDGSWFEKSANQEAGGGTGGGKTHQLFLVCRTDFACFFLRYESPEWCWPEKDRHQKGSRQTLSCSIILFSQQAQDKLSGCSSSQQLNPLRSSVTSDTSTSLSSPGPLTPHPPCLPGGDELPPYRHTPPPEPPGSATSVKSNDSTYSSKYMTAVLFLVIGSRLFDQLLQLAVLCVCRRFWARTQVSEHWVSREVSWRIFQTWSRW